MPSPSSLKLYSYYRSSCSYRVRIALNIKSLKYEIIPVHLVKDGGEQFQETLTKLNPSQKVPVLIHNNQPISQSMAIIEYLDGIHPESLLFPTEKLQKAVMSQFCQIINSDIQPLQNLRVLKLLIKEYQFNDLQKIEWIKHWIHQGFMACETLIEKNLSDKKNIFCFGQKPSAADCFLIPQIYNALRFDMDMTQFPHLNAVYNHCMTLEAFQQASPEQQPDFPNL